MLRGSGLGHLIYGSCDDQTSSTAALFSSQCRPCSLPYDQSAWGVRKVYRVRSEHPNLAWVCACIHCSMFHSSAACRYGALLIGPTGPMVSPQLDLGLTHEQLAILCFIGVPCILHLSSTIGSNEFFSCTSSLIQHPDCQPRVHACDYIAQRSQQFQRVSRLES